MEIISEQQIYKLINTKIRELADIINDSPERALQLLAKNHWDLERAYENFFDQTEAESSIEEDIAQLCYICYCPIEDDDDDNIHTLSCSHQFHRECFATFMRVISSDADLKFYCPMYPSCQSLIPFSYFDPEQERNRRRVIFEHFMSHSNVIYRYCPNVHCNRIIKIANRRQLTKPVRCECGYEVCLNCRELSHRPISCRLSTEWQTIITENDLQGQSVKPCPKCHCLIAKEGGCPRVVCNCGFTFCWHCLNELQNVHFCSCGLYNSNNVSGTVDNVRSQTDIDFSEIVGKVNMYDDYLIDFTRRDQEVELDNKFFNEFRIHIRENYNYLKYYSIQNFMTLKHEERQDELISARIMILSSLQEDMLKLYDKIVEDFSLVDRLTIQAQMIKFVKMSLKFREG